MAEAKVEQRFICVWFDNRLMRSDDYIDTQNELRSVVKEFQSFSNSDKCVDFITDITEGRIFFITSYILAKFLVPLIHSYEQIDSIYIFCSTKSSSSDDQSWTKDYKKIKGIFLDIKLICDRFLQDSTEKENEQVTISFISSSDINSHDINRQDPSFMYFQLLKEIILNDHQGESHEETKRDMLNYCRQTYEKSLKTLIILDEFEQNFLPELSIYWYTRECFLYQMLNTALWTPQLDVLYKLRYFIRHLYYQLSSEAALQRDKLSSMIVVYRGQNMSADQIEKLKKNVGGFVSFNNFLSTSLQRQIALNFLIGSDVGVLFEIQIDEAIEKFPFANIEHLSFHQGEKSEHELLFAMGSVFRIIRIDKHPNFYRVQLKLSEDIDQQLAKYTKHTREKTRTSHSFLSLLRLMNELKQYGSVDRFAEILREDNTLGANPSILAAIHHTFGLIYHGRDQYKEAINHYQKSLNIEMSYDTIDDSSLAVTYNNIACVYISQTDYKKAFEFQKLALDCERNSKDPTPSLIILYTNNLGRIYHHQEKYKEALDCHKQALELQKLFLGENDSSLIETYNMISALCYKLYDFDQGSLYKEQATALENTTCQLNPTASADNLIRTGNTYFSQEQYKEALNHFNRALEIQQQYFLPNNPTLGTTYNYIGRSYYKLKQFQESIPYYKKALEIEVNSLADDHPSIATSYYNISKSYIGLSHWSEALENSLKAVEQLKKSFQTDVNTLASYIHHAGYVYHEQQQYEQALIYYEEALDLYRTHLSEDSMSLFSVYHRTARVYYHLKRYDQALVLYQKVLEIELKLLPDNATAIANGYSDIANAYQGLKQFDEALIAAEQAIHQALKTLPYNHSDVLQYQANLNSIKQKQRSNKSYEVNQS